MTTPSRWPRWLKIALPLVLILGAVVALVGYNRFLRDYGAASFADPAERFKYGSIGAENDAGIPYWIFHVLPRVFPDKLPKPGIGYAAFGVNWEQGQELPVGFSKRRIGFDRVVGFLRGFIRFIRRTRWTTVQRDWLRDYFHREIEPLLSPTSLDPARPLPRSHSLTARESPTRALRAPP